MQPPKKIGLLLGILLFLININLISFFASGKGDSLIVVALWMVI
jgi:sodium-dependent dicarboxylate transporter 2/3/5|tara:strand:+ start:1249 stop:1380 length:132 start_codon:yes stop_codon:yes gene_type:complete